MKNSLMSLDRWLGPDTRIRIMSFTIDDGSTLIPPKLSSRRILAYGDSITEGLNVYNPFRNLTSNDAHVTWMFSLAKAMDAEFSVVAWADQGYTFGAPVNVPAFWSSDGQANTSAWKWISSKYPRSFDVCPDYIINNQGVNDGRRGGKLDQVYTNALGWLQDMRNTCLTSKIFIVVPFSRVMEDTITKAFKAYQDSNPDNSTILIKLGEGASKGIANFNFGTPSFEAVDGLHPRAWRSSELGALVAIEMAPYLLPKTDLNKTSRRLRN